MTHCVSPTFHPYICLLLNPLRLPEGLREEDKPAAEEEEEEEDPEHGVTSLKKAGLLGIFFSVIRFCIWCSCSISQETVICSLWFTSLWEAKVDGFSVVF